MPWPKAEAPGHDRDHRHPGPGRCGRGHRTARGARTAHPLLPGLGGPGRRRAECSLLLKAEHLQHSGSFKLRGAANAVLALGADRIVTGSSGNHGIALARLAAPLGVEVTVVMAAGASPAKAALIRALGGRIVSVPGGVAERDARALDLAGESGAVFVPSSDHELVIAGQGTVGAEILAEVPDVETLYVPTGGGGLLAGVCLSAHGHRVRVVGVEPAATPATPGRWRQAARPAGAERHRRRRLRAQQPGAVTFPVIRDRVDDLIAVSDAEILAAAAFLRRRGIEAEPSGAVALAGALRAGRGAGRAVAIVSGGNTTAALTAAAATEPYLEEIS